MTDCAVRLALAKKIAPARRSYKRKAGPGAETAPRPPMVKKQKVPGHWPGTVLSKEKRRPYLWAAGGALSFFISRLLRRAALLGWMTPFWAARSRAAMAARVAALASSGVASRARRTAVRVVLRLILLRTRLRLLDRTRLIAEAVLAN